MVETSQILETIKVALGLKYTPTLDDTVDTIEEWDSLGHLSMLVALDKKLNGQAAKLEDLGSCEKIIDLIAILKNNGLVNS